ncbi:MAG: ribonuclease Z, partial [Muribaculaceae bacterium]|nr:ribonuclease Z [Muribaculaceae bacterium]
ATTVYAFADGVKWLQGMMKQFCGDTAFPIYYEVIKPGQTGVIYEDDSLTVEVFPLYHRVAATGYIFREKPKLLHVNGDMIRFHDVPRWQIVEIKKGMDFVKPDGTVVPNSYLTMPSEPAMSYAYASDTLADSRVAKAVEGVDVLYHEATYDDSQEALARDRGHSTAGQAARIAAQAGVGRLVLGHFSKRYLSEDLMLEQARAIFPNTIAANEGMRINLL